MRIDNQIESGSQEELLDVVFRQGAIGMALCSISPDNSRWLRVNQKLCDMLGYARAELLQLTPLKISLPGEADFTASYNKQLLRGDLSSHSCTMSYARKDGTSICTNTWFSAVLDQDGIPSQIFAAIEHISERQRQDTLTRGSETGGQSIVDFAPVGIFRTTLNGDVTYVNKHWCKIAGMTRDAAIGKGWMQGLHPDDREKIGASWYSAASTAIEHFENEYRYVTSDGLITWCFVRAVRELDGDGKIIGYVGALTDITARKQVEAAVAKREAQFKDYAETAADYFWEMGPDLKYTHFGGRFEEVIGIPPNQFLGLTREQAWRERTPAIGRNDAPFLDVAARRSYENMEIQWSRPDGGIRTLSISAKPIFDADGIFLGYRGAGRDITEIHTRAENLSHQASHDGLTGLINRAEFERRLQRVLETARKEQTEHALCYMDLDRFKIINDTCGHMAGDELLRQLSQLLSKSVRGRDTLARLGGDEFGVLMEHCSLERAYRVAEGTRRAVEKFRFAWENHEFRIGVSIGLAPVTGDSESVFNLLSAADRACYAAKEGGRNRVHVYRPDNA